MTGDSVFTLEVDRTNIARTRLVEEPLCLSLEENEVLLKVNRQALTANNISYAMHGDTLDYWRFFSVDDKWGRLPGMGWGSVLASASPQVRVGELVWGCFPFSTHHRCVGGASDGSTFDDVSTHRSIHPIVYRRFERASQLTIYAPDREDHDCVLRGLFSTAWLLEDYLAVNQSFHSSSCVITSASSKTSIALARCLQLRGDQSCIGVTSPMNLEFCRNLGVYDQVVEYGDLSSQSVNQAVTIVDMAGNMNVLRELHHRYGDNVRSSIRIGATHQDSSAPPSGISRAKPSFFFAPAHSETRVAEIGAQQFFGELSKAFVKFRRWCDSWMFIESSFGPEAVEETYHAVRTGATNPSNGHIVSFWPHASPYVDPRTRNIR